MRIGADGMLSVSRMGLKPDGFGSFMTWFPYCFLMEYRKMAL
jgi:hypothetical protein